MSFEATYKEYKLKFKFPARTSKNILYDKKTWYIILKSNNQIGIGECSYISHLSKKSEQQITKKIQEVCSLLNKNIEPEIIINDLKEYPGIKFAIETALIDLKNKGNKILFPSKFTEGKEGIKINGLIWINNKEETLKQIENKISKGFSCIKMKIGSMSFTDEIEIISKIRNISKDIEIRLDANGAFNYNQALEIINALKKFDIHSIEQPIPPGNPIEMKKLCQKSSIPIALDEELIFTTSDKNLLIETIKPHYIVLKSGLLGGFSDTIEWINIANYYNIGWWITSALESNIGLNAIAQWTYTLKNTFIQGLGTGLLYDNNISSPLLLKGEFLYYNPDIKWDLSNILN